MAGTIASHKETIGNYSHGMYWSPPGIDSTKEGEREEAEDECSVIDGRLLHAFVTSMTLKEQMLVASHMKTDLAELRNSLLGALYTT